MITVTVPLKSLSHITDSIQKLEIVEDNLTGVIVELETNPRHAISWESTQLAIECGRRDLVRDAIKLLKDFVKTANEDFSTKADIDSSISASQPYNAGSRENY